LGIYLFPINESPGFPSSSDIPRCMSNITQTFCMSPGVKVKILSMTCKTFPAVLPTGELLFSHFLILPQLPASFALSTSTPGPLHLLFLLPGLWQLTKTGSEASASGTTVREVTAKNFNIIITPTKS
jgi:hypothetical protein